MQQYPAVFLSVLCLWLFSQSTSSVPLDVQTKDKLKIILPQSAGFQSDNDIYPVEDNAEHVHIVTAASYIDPLTTTSTTSTSTTSTTSTPNTSTTTTTTTNTTTTTTTSSTLEVRKPTVSISTASPDDGDIESEETTEQSLEDNSHWSRISSFQLSDGLSVEKYKSALTGLTVVLANAESPIVNGYFCLATEALDDDGLPHTLEHLIFLGSEDYPYKEVLDLLANRALADRTNAWTDTDHTCYTVYTAGPSGFLSILPVYLDHILYPNLREEDYLTEVHHINGEGQDAGVVYSEMQGVEQSTANIMYFSLAEKLYPNSGYHSETGGYLQNLRNSTNIKKVRDYHRQFYRTENLVLTITGRMNEEDLFNTLRKTEEKVLRKRSIQGCEEFIRPWTSPIENLNLTEDFIYEIEYPSEDETLGSIAVAWRLDQSINENIEMLEAYKLIMKYLTNTQVSPFEVAFVENNDPLATSVSSDTLEVRKPALLIEFENVPVDRLDEVIPKMDQLLQDIVDAGPDDFDLERITNFIDREVVNNLKEMENSPHLFVPDATVLDMLYAEEPDDLRKFLSSSQSNNQFRHKNSTFWVNLIRDQFINQKKIVLKGKPSRAKVEELTEKEERRIEKQIQDLGPAGLARKQQELEMAIDSQKLPGREVLEKISLGNVETIQFRSFETYNTTLNEDNVIDFTKLPFKMQVEDVNSSFVQLYIFLSTESLTVRQKELLPLVLDMWLDSPVMRDGTLQDIETIVKRRTKTLLNIDNGLGFSGSTFSPGAFSDTVIVEVQFERRKLGPAVDYLSDVLNYPHFTGLKVNTTVTNLLNGIPSLKLSATDVLRVLHDGIYFSNESNINHCNFVRQTRVLEELQETLRTEPDSLIAELYQIVDQLARADNALVYLATKVPLLTREYGPDLAVLGSLLNTSSSSSSPSSLATRFVIKSEHEHRNSSAATLQHLAFGVGGTESCYLKQSVRYNNTDWTSSAVASERVMLQYISDRMYDEVRGQGLTYGVSLSLSVTEGRTTLSLTRSSRVVEAYSTVREILERFVSNEDNWDPSLVESAKGSLIYSWTEKEETVEDLVDQTVKAYFRQTDSNYNRDFVRALGKVSLADIKTAARQILPLFLSDKTSQTVLICPPASLEEVIEDFRNSGLQLNKLSSLENSILYN